jgi:hypothetical protein
VMKATLPSSFPAMLCSFFDSVPTGRLSLSRAV